MTRLYPTSYTPAEHRRGLEALRADVLYDTPPRVCQCGEDLDWEPPHRAEPDTGCSAWRGGYCCGGCGYTEEVEPIDEDAVDILRAAIAKAGGQA